MGTALAKEGIICAVPSYRLSEESLVIQRLPRFFIASAIAAYALLYTTQKEISILFSWQWLCLTTILFTITFAFKQAMLNGVHHPDHVEDCALATHATIRYCLDHWKAQQKDSYAQECQCDARFRPSLVLMGHSAGAHIAAMLALCPEFMDSAGAKGSSDMAPFDVDDVDDNDDVDNVDVDHVDHHRDDRSISASREQSLWSMRDILCGVVCMSGPYHHKLLQDSILARCTIKCVCVGVCVCI